MGAVNSPRKHQFMMCTSNIGGGHAGHAAVGPSSCGDAGPGTGGLLCRGGARRRARVPHACLSDVRSVRLVVQRVQHAFSSRCPPVRERHPATGGARSSKLTGGVTGPGRSMQPGTSWLTAGFGRSVLTGPDSPVTEFIPALRTECSVCVCPVPGFS